LCKFGVSFFNTKHELMLPKLQKIISKKTQYVEIKEILKNVLFEGKYLVATNAVALMFIPHGLKVDEPFLLPVDVYKKYTVAKIKSIKIQEGTIIAYDKDGSILHTDKTRPDLVEQYPDWRDVIPSKDGDMMGFPLSIDADYLGIAQSIWGCPDLTLRQYIAKEKPIIVSPPKDYKGRMLLMPIMKHI